MFSWRHRVSYGFRLMKHVDFLSHFWPLFKRAGFFEAAAKIGSRLSKSLRHSVWINNNSLRDVGLTMITNRRKRKKLFYVFVCWRKTMLSDDMSNVCCIRKSFLVRLNYLTGSDNLRCIEYLLQLNYLSVWNTES